jgi:signal transduction histidine kinase
MVFDKIDLLAELEEAVLMYTEKARRENIELVFDELSDSAVVMGDKNRLRQVFINIIDNAIKYSNPGGRVGVTVYQRNDEVVISVEDKAAA